MKIKITLLFLLCASIVAIFSCRKEPTKQVENNVLMTRITVEEAKTWFDKNYVKSSGDVVLSNSKQPFIDKPLWKHSRSWKQKNSSEILKVPVYTFNKDNPFSRDLLIAKRPDGTIKQIVLDILPSKAYVKKMNARTGKTKSNYIDPKDFSGYMLQYQMNGRLIKGLQFVNGKLVAQIKPKAGASSLGKKYKSTTVSNWEGNMNTGFMVDEVTIVAAIETTPALTDFMFVSLELPEPPEIEEISLEDYYYAMLEYFYSYLVYPPPTVVDTHNLLSDPCLQATLEAVKTAGLNNKISQILSDVFGKNPHIELYYNDVTNMPDSLNGLFAANDPQPDGTFKLYINLNENTLPDMSKEYATVTILHEAIHAYLSFGNATGLYDHEDMALGYRGAIADYLTNIYGTSSATAEALAWQGLTGTSIWDTYQNTYPNAASGIKSIHDAHKDPNGTAGTRCP